MTQETLDILALTLIPGLGTARIRRLIDLLGSPGEVLRATRSQLRALRVPREARYYVSLGYARRDAEQTVRQCSELGVRILGWEEDDYPKLLREIFDPPLVVYCLGDVRVLSRHAVAVVGTRRCSSYGSEVAYTLGRELAELGLVVVSGLAVGIDARAHLGSLAGGGPTVAVLGTGVDIPYPRSNRGLFKRTRENGCIVSEFPLGTPPTPQNFPIRNRIISGLCWGTVIPEAAEFSGSLITARLTLEQNRVLWAVPGNITSPGSFGPNYLIKQGARPLLSTADLLEDLPPRVLADLRADAFHPLEEAVLNENERKIYRLLSVDNTRSFDFLLLKTGWTVPQLSEALVSLECKNLIRSYPGRRYGRRLRSLGGAGAKGGELQLGAGPPSEGGLER